MGTVAMGAPNGSGLVRMDVTTHRVPSLLGPRLDADDLSDALALGLDWSVAGGGGSSWPDPAPFFECEAFGPLHLSAARTRGPEVPFHATIAVDGKITRLTKKWGVGLLDLGTGLGVGVGGPCSVTPFLCGPDGDMNQAATETWALALGCRWAACRDRHPAHLNPDTGRPPRPILIVSDRTASLRTLAVVTRKPGCLTRACQGFRWALAAAAESLIRLLLIQGSVGFAHKSAVPSEAGVPPLSWQPDLLAVIGMRAGLWDPSDWPTGGLFHLIRWENSISRGSLLCYTEATLHSPVDAARHLGLPEVNGHPPAQVGTGPGPSSLGPDPRTVPLPGRLLSLTPEWVLVD